MRLKQVALTIFMCGLVGSAVQAFAPHNFWDPYDPNLRLPSWEEPDFWQKNSFRIGVNLEAGSTNDAHDFNDESSNILRIHDTSQATIPMLMTSQNPKAQALLKDLTTACAGQPLDDGVRGHICPSGHFDMVDATIHARYKLPFSFIPGTIALAAYLPIRHIDVDNIVLSDLTENKTAADIKFKERVSSDLANLTKELGCLDLCSWSKTGVGDLTLLLDWRRNFIQDKENLQSATLYAQFGVSIPTGCTKDEDKAFSMPLGYDGAWGMPFGLGLALNFTGNFKLGLDTQFLLLFDEQRERRLKTELHQTEFLLLTKGEATKEHGLTWKFNIHFQWYHFFKGLSLKAAYQYIKHDDDRLDAKSNDFSHDVINSAHSLEEWNMHHLIGMLNYDFFDEVKDWYIKPQFSLFVKVPVSAKKVIDPVAFGGQLAFTF